MGQVQDKCSCLFKREDKETFKFEGSVIRDEEIEGKSLTFKEKLMKSKNSFSDLEKMIYEDNVNIARVSMQQLQNQFQLQNNKNISSSNSVVVFDQRALIKIQKVCKGFLIRKHLVKIKKILMDYENDLTDQYQRNFKTLTLLKSEREVKSPYDRSGWKNFYQEDTLFNYNYGKVYLNRMHVFDKSSFYTGDMNSKGEKHGYGVLLQKNGVKWEGSWKHNQFTGWGRLIDTEGTVYEGYYANGVLSGKGERMTTKSHFRGDFRNNLREGIGSEETPEQSYVGEYKSDKKNGNGKLTYKKMNDVYEGEFQDNMITGYGYYIWANQDSYKGTFINGKMHGRGLYKWPDGGEYVGEYVNNIKEGQGRFKWSNGKIFEGPFKNGRPHGTGKLLYGENTIEVEFRDGKLVRSPSPNAANPNTSRKPKDPSSS
jgi:hypothetical protein